MPTTKPAPDFAGAFAGLRKILATYAPTCVVVHDQPDYYHLDTRFINPRNRQAVMLGAVRTQKHYVSFHFMPIYFNPPLMASLSPALKKRMQGKACFNFTAPDTVLFAELERVTQRGIADFKKLGWG
jgi:hypothetical protein